MRHVALAVAVIAVVSPARAAAPCGMRGAPWVAIELDPTVSSTVARSVVAQLAADLAGRGIDVCDARATGSPPPVATVHVVGGGAAVGVEVEVRDALTDKRLSRDLDLSALPEDGRGLALAATAGELLRASWAELALRGAPPPRAPPPPEVRAIVSADLAPPPPSRRSVELAIALAGEISSGRSKQFGVDARSRFDWADHGALLARVGFREIASRSSADGSIAGTAVVAGVGAAVPFGNDSWSLAALARIDVARISFVGESDRGAAASGAATSVWAGAGALGSVSLGGSARLTADVTAGPVIVPVRAADGADVVMAMSGLCAAASVGVGGAF